MTVAGKPICQINNLRLHQGHDGLFRVYTLDGSRCLEEFRTSTAAKTWMRETLDYLRRT